jgi:putative SbcD/Mre11-related phosphoesterase
LCERAKILTLIEGNHDGKLDWLAEQIPSVEIKKSHCEGDLFFIHGDVIPPEIPAEISWIVIGHEHPAISLRDPVTNRFETYKCFLFGDFQGKKLLVQPSFNLLIQGTDLGKEEVLSPFLRQSRLERFFVYLVADDGNIYDFGPLRHLR